MYGVVEVNFRRDFFWQWPQLLASDSHGSWPLPLLALGGMESIVVPRFATSP
jgi:hypothetical protein